MLAGATNKSAAALIEEKQRALEVQSAQEKMQITMQKLVAQATDLAPQLHKLVDLFVKFASRIETIVPMLIAYKTTMILVTLAQAGFNLAQ